MNYKTKRTKKLKNLKLYKTVTLRRDKSIICTSLIILIPCFLIFAFRSFILWFDIGTFSYLYFLGFCGTIRGIVTILVETWDGSSSGSNFNQKLPLGDIKKEIDIKKNLYNSTTLLYKSSSGNINPVDNMNEGNSPNNANIGSGNNQEQTAEETSASASRSNIPTIPTDIPVVNTAPIYGVSVPPVARFEVSTIA